jgi:hypothetical protein
MPVVTPTQRCASCNSVILTASVLPGTTSLVCVSCYTGITGSAPLPSNIFDVPEGLGVHKGGGGFSAVFPDVCTTPTPGGPVPIPYPNIATSSGAATQKVKTDGTAPMTKGANFTMSTGDEAGSAGAGVVSSKIKGRAEYVNYSFDVKIEGKTPVRLTDLLNRNP